MTLSKSERKIHPSGYYTKRKEVKDDEGWTHVIDKPQGKKARALCKKKSGGLQSSLQSHAGDYEINGFAYINRNIEEMEKEFTFWKKQWEDSQACTELQVLVKGGKENNTFAMVKDIIVLGLGSMLSARRDARRCSAIQLAAVLTILQALKETASVVIQDPCYNELDEQFLALLGFVVVKDPKAFSMVGKHSLVFAVHCYRDLYCAIARGINPAVLIGTKIENFRRSDWSQEVLTNLEMLENMIKNCKEMDFPQIRYDFSDTKIYWRVSSIENKH